MWSPFCSVIWHTGDMSLRGSNIGVTLKNVQMSYKLLIKNSKCMFMKEMCFYDIFCNKMKESHQAI